MTFFLIAGLVLLVAGAEALVRGASSLAAKAGVPSLIVGLTVVAFGTSAPELAVSIGSSLSGQPNMAVGNVVGSNIFNVLFILGVAALVAPLTAATQLVRLDVPLGRNPGFSRDATARGKRGDQSGRGAPPGGRHRPVHHISHRPGPILVRPGR